MDIQVRQATIKDLHLLVDVFDQYRIFYKQHSDREGAERFLFEKFEHNESVIFIARDEEKSEAAGFTQLYPIFSSVSLKRKWLLNDLFVAQLYRKQGIAEKLMHAAKEFAIATRAAGLDLSTAVTNIPAQRLYERLGYVKDTAYLHYSLSL
jgi:ribosomal protein S18 acetylase RimI-like enzyme